MTNIFTYVPSLPATPLRGLVIMASVISASLLFGAAAVRRSPLAQLVEQRRRGVHIRNESIRTDEALRVWLEKVEQWRAETIRVARKNSKVLAERLDPLNEVYGFPGDLWVHNLTHRRHLGIASEILRRIEDYIKSRQ